MELEMEKCRLAQWKKWAPIVRSSSWPIWEENLSNLSGPYAKDCPIDKLQLLGPHTEATLRGRFSRV